MKTVLITGCSSGYGLETARHFHAQGWNVIATMRAPREGILPRSVRLSVLALDVTRPESITAAIEAAGPIDALVNNAGIGVIGVFEATPMSTVREVFETNTFGATTVAQDDYHMAHLAYEMNVAAAKLARVFGAYAKTGEAA